MRCRHHHLIQLGVWLTLNTSTRAPARRTSRRPAPLIDGVGRQPASRRPPAPGCARRTASAGERFARQWFAETHARSKLHVTPTVENRCVIAMASQAKRALAANRVERTGDISSLGKSFINALVDRRRQGEVAVRAELIFENAILQLQNRAVEGAAA